MRRSSPKLPSSSFYRRPRRGSVLVETIISMTISGFIATVSVYLMFQSALTTKDMYAETRTRATRMGAIDQIRYRLTEAEIGTCVVSNGNRTIQFVDPNLGTTSEFTFNITDNTLIYDVDVDDGTAGIEVIRGPIDLTFELQEEGALVLLNVKTEAPIGMGDVDTQEGETAVYLRNV